MKDRIKVNGVLYEAVLDNDDTFAQLRKELRTVGTNPKGPEDREVFLSVVTGLLSMLHDRAPRFDIPSSARQSILKSINYLNNAQRKIQAES